MTARLVHPVADGNHHRVTVPVDGRTYDVLVGDGAADRIAELLPESAKRIAVVTQPDVGVDVELGLPFDVSVIADGESAKNLSTIESLCRRWATWGLTRGDVVLAIGGGVVTDVAGFAAAVYHRGVAVVHVSTTLLGQIDAAIGGKTGVNLPEGKNLVGAFWQPSGVICDTAHLATLPPREHRSGLGELAKYHFLGGGRLDELDLAARVAECVAIKADVVASDERESGRRAILNYGHTLAHSLETAGSYDIRHGEAVAVGLLYAAELARLLGRIDEARVDEHRRVLGAYDLTARLPPGADPAELMALFSRDKKAIDGITFVLDGPRGVEPVTGIDPDAMRDAFSVLT